MVNILNFCINTGDMADRHAAITGNVVLFESPGKDFLMENHVVRSLEQGEILVKNLYTTICGSDLHTYCGLRKEPSPTVLGHEIVGQIVDIHPDHTSLDLRGNQLVKGDLITWAIFSSDPSAPLSLAGIPQKAAPVFKYGHALAVEPDIFHGGLGSYCILRKHTAVLKLPAELPLEVAATINCSVSTVAGALRMAGTVKGKTVLITGMGHLGITCAAMCRAAGATWIAAADISEARLHKAHLFGADHTFNIADDRTETTSYIKTNLPAKGVDIVFDMSGSPEAMELGLDALATGGTAVWIGAVFNTRKVNINPEAIIRNLITIKGLHNYNLQDFEQALHFIENNWNRFPFAAAVEKEFPLDQATQAFEYALQHKPYRVGVKISN